MATKPTSTAREVVPRHEGQAPSGLAVRIWSTVRTSFSEFIDSDPFSQAATIAYYTIFSLPAVMIITVMAAATFYDAPTVRNAIIEQAGHLIGRSSAEDLRLMLDKAAVTETRFMARALGLIALVISAGSVFASLQSALNHVWKVEAKPGKAVWKYLSTRLMSLALVACFGFLMLVSLVLDAALVAVSDRLAMWFSGVASFIIHAADLALSFGIVTCIFAVIFRVLPDARVAWRHVWGGALVTALLFTLGKFLIGFYVSKSGVSDAYGTASTVIVILMWVYYSTVIMLFGAHYTHVRTRDRGPGVRPMEHAVKVPPAPPAAPR